MASQRERSKELMAAAQSDPDAIDLETVDELLDADGATGRSAALQALSVLATEDPDSAVEYADRIGDLLEDDVLAVRSTAALASMMLARERPDAIVPAVPTLVDMLSEDPPLYRYRAAGALAPLTESHAEAFVDHTDELIGHLVDGPTFEADPDEIATSDELSTADKKRELSMLKGRGEELDRSRARSTGTREVIANVLVEVARIDPETCESRLSDVRPALSDDEPSIRGAAIEIVRHVAAADPTAVEAEIEALVDLLEDVEVHFEEEQGMFDFGEPDVVRAVDGVSLDIEENDVVALVGESGCGKTTLGKTSIGLQRPTGGSVRYRGQDIWDAKDKRGDVDIPYEEIRRSLQIIHQDPGSSLNPNRRVMKILEAPLKRWQDEMSAGDRRREVLQMLERVGMTPPDDYAGRYPHQLSGGEQQRVALIRALLMDPDLILADEAISALDVSLRVEMMDLMLELQEQFNTSFVAVSHDLSNARYFASHGGGRIGVMYLGRLVEIGPPEQIINNPKHPYTKVLRLATPDLRAGTDGGEPPVRKIDIPDPKNPPSGCRFHTRCPKATEACRGSEQPPAYQVGPDHKVACFREDGNHEYWSSEPLPGTDHDSDIDDSSPSAPSSSD